MSNSNLAKPFSIQLTKDQYKALEILKDKGFNKNILIRNALDEILHREFRPILKELRKSEINKDIPEFAL